MQEEHHRVPSPLSAETSSDFENPVSWATIRRNSTTRDQARQRIFSMKNPLKRYIATLHAACNAVLQRGLPAAGGIDR